MELPALKTSQELRKFGLSTGVVVVILFGVGLPWLFSHPLPFWPWVVSSVLWLLALVWPTGLRPVARLWLKVGSVLGWMNTRILLGLMYYTVFLVMAVAMRLAGKDPMSRKLDPQAKTYRVESRRRSPNHMERPF